MKLVGIDLAWQSEQNPTGLAYGHLNSGELVLDKIEYGLSSIDSILDCIDSSGRPNGIAIDAPLVIRNETGQRACEKLIGKEYGSRKASCHTSNLRLYPEAYGVKLSCSLEAWGYSHLARSAEFWQLECYPHPALIEIFGLNERHLYKKGKVEIRRAGQAALAQLLLKLADSPALPMKVTEYLDVLFDVDYINGLKGSALKTNEDILDAVVCLYIAGLYAVGITERVFGSIIEGYIFVPKKRCI